MKLTKKLISVLLLVMLIISNVSTVLAMDFAGPNSNDVPAGIPIENKKNLRLNMTLLRDKNIIVYGDVGNVSKNRYKNGSIPVNTYKWIYRIWDRASSYHYGSKITAESMYNNIAIGNILIGYTKLQINNMRSNIEKALGWDIKYPIGIFGSTTDTTSAYNYAHVYSLPGRYNNGQVLMHHYSEGTIWYANFTTVVPDSGLDKEPIKPVASFENKIEGETCTIDLRGTINDLDYYKENIQKSIYYTRQDIVSWDFEFKDQTGKTTYNVGVRNTTTNTDKAKFSFPFEVTENQKIISGRVIVNYKKGEGIISSTSDWVELPLDVIPSPPPLEIYDEDVNTYPIEPEIIAPHYMLDTEKFKLEELTDYENVVGSTDVYLNGKKLSSLDSAKFLKGQYLFPLIGSDKLYSYSIRYKNQLNFEAEYSDYVLVYTTKPATQVKVTGTQKENRKLIAINDTNSINNSYLLERSSMQVIPDYNPAVIANIWNFVLTRNEKIQMTFDQVSTDGDIISLGKSTYKLYYDLNNDGVAESLTKSGKAEEFNEYKPTKLGTYKVVFYVEETFGEPTISKFITEEDRRYTILEQQFYVENLAPSTQLYIDVPENYPEVDVMILNDESITRELNNNIVSTRVSLMNTLIRENLDPSVQIWDLNTYIYSQDASTTDNTGWVYPNDTIIYSSNGYSGTLSRYKVVNNEYRVDEGEYETKTVSTTRPNKEIIYYNSSGAITGSSNPQLPDSIVVNGVTCYKVDTWSGAEVPSYSTDKDGKKYVSKVTISWTALYEGEKKEWVSNWVWYDDYKGYYSGTIYKYVKQQFNSAYRDTSNKYIVYFANTAVNNIADYNYIINRANSKIIIIGNDAVKKDSRIKKDLFINNSKSLEEIYKEIVQFISNDNIQERGAVVLVNTEFNISYADVDMEDDIIQANGFQIVHNQDYFDNSLGQEANTIIAFDESKYTLDSLPNKFQKTGEFSIYRKVKDIPIGHEDKSEFSNDAKITLLVHRKPIANCTLDWTFINLNGTYKTTWLDKSYDPDLQYKDPEGKKGIRERKIKYRKVDTADWIYEIPDNLVPASYELEYIVKDNFGVWSDPFKMTFELPAIPPAQINAKLRTELPNFSLSSVPASENLIAYDIWTRYPFDLKLQLSLYNGATQVSPTKEVTYSVSTGRKVGQDIFWNDILHNIPATLRSQMYIMKIRALDIVEPTRYSDINFNVTVKTPINLAPKISEKITAAKNFEIEATTSKYVNSTYIGSGVKVTLFDGTSHARTLTLNGTRSNWNITTNQPVSIPEGIYTAKFVATLPSGETEIKTVQYRFVHNTPPVIDDGKIFTDLNMNYIYENDDVNYTLSFHDADLTHLDINIKLYTSTNTTTPIIEYNETVIPNGTAYEPYTLQLIDDIPLGDYILKATVTDDYNETATLTTNFTAHDLWVKGAVTHTTDWEKNRQTYNTKYPTKARTVDTYWNGESFETSANTTVINIASMVKCKKVSVEIINNDKPSDNRYLQWLNPDNITSDKWKLSYWDKEWLSKDGDVTVKWGANKKQEITLRFTAYFNNDWVETVDVKVYIDNQDDYWKLHRSW